MSAADDRRQRRRWLTLAEFVGIAGLVIAALGLYFTWSDRRADRADKVSSERAKEVVLFDAAVEDHGRTLRLADPNHKIQSIDLRFPSALGAPDQQGLVSPRIESDWVAKPLLALAKDGGDRSGKLPVLVTADFWDGDTHHRDRAIYDIAWRSEHTLPFGHTLRLDGAALRERGGDSARVDAIWSREKPAPGV